MLVVVFDCENTFEHIEQLGNALFSPKDDLPNH